MGEPDVEEAVQVSNATTQEVLKSPYPYPGGKAKVADAVWARLGNVDNFCEPFAGSLAVLLRRPADHFAGGYRVETVNDLNHYIANFWRAVAKAPDEVAMWADSPVLEADLHARHKWLVRSQEAAEWRERMRTDPDHYDTKVAGWWVWGACAWIGTGWCVENWTVDGGDSSHKQKMPDFDGGRGVLDVSGGRPQLCDVFDIGRGVNSNGGAGTCDARRAWLTDWMRRLADRLRLVRTCYGHWSRICDSDSTLTRLGTTGVFLDPPYPIRSTTGKKSRADGLYANDKAQDLDKLRDEVLAWCRKWGGNKAVRVAVCGYEGDGYEALTSEGWSEESWEASGGYGNQKRGKGKAENAKRERIWYSPHCIAPQRGLFDDLEVA